MRSDAFKQLLSDMPRIAKAVNSFDSPEVQKLAFQAFVTTLMQMPPSPDPINDAVNEPELPAESSDEDSSIEELMDSSAIDDDNEPGISPGESVHSFINAG